MQADEAVSEVVQKLKDRGLTGPYPRPFVVARINPIRFSKATSFDFDQVLEKMLAAAKKFNVEKIRQQDQAGPCNCRGACITKNAGDTSHGHVCLHSAPREHRQGAR